MADLVIRGNKVVFRDNAKFDRVIPTKKWPQFIQRSSGNQRYKDVVVVSVQTDLGNYWLVVETNPDTELSVDYVNGLNFRLYNKRSVNLAGLFPANEPSPQKLVQSWNLDSPGAITTNCVLPYMEGMIYSYDVSSIGTSEYQGYTPGAFYPLTGSATGSGAGIECISNDENDYLLEFVILPGRDYKTGDSLTVVDGAASGTWTVTEVRDSLNYYP